MRQISVATLAAALIGSATISAAETLRVAPPAPIIDIDPHGPNSVLRETLVAARQIYDPLIDFVDGKPSPRLATSWTQIDERTWRFDLRDGVTFHDGTPLDAADVKASIERLSKATGGLVRLWADLEAVELAGDRAVVIRLKAPLGPFLRNVALLSIAPSEAIAAAGDKYGAAVRLPGTGPFSVSGFEPGTGLQLQANASYWDGAPAIEGVRFTAIPELTGRVTALVNDEIDVTWGVPDDQIPSLQGNPDVSVSIVPSVIYYYAWFNSNNPPFNDVRVRRALWHAVDIHQVVGDLLPFTGSVARAPVAEPVFGWSPQEPYSYDPDLARSLLAEAGHPSGFSSELKYSVGFGASVDQMAQAFASYWSKVGVTITPTQMEHAVWTADFRELKWDMVMATNPTFTQDADYTLFRLYTSKDGVNEENGYVNPELDALLLAARREPDQAKRATLYAQATTILWADAPGIFPSEAKGVYATRAGVSGMEFSPRMTPGFKAVTIN